MTKHFNTLAQNMIIIAGMIFNNSATAITTPAQQTDTTTRSVVCPDYRFQRLVCGPKDIEPTAIFYECSINSATRNEQGHVVLNITQEEFPAPKEWVYDFAQRLSEQEAKGIRGDDKYQEKFELRLKAMNTAKYAYENRTLECTF